MLKFCVFVRKVPDTNKNYLTGYNLEAGAATGD